MLLGGVWRERVLDAEVTGDQVVADDEASESCLHCDINELVREYIDAQESVDIGELTARMAESLADLILLASESEQGKLLAATIAQLGQAFLGKSEEASDGQDRPH